MLWRWLVFFLACFAGLNLAVTQWVERSELLAYPWDVQTRSTLDARLGAFARRARGERAVFLGDSLVRGQKLRETEGAAWSGRTLSAAYEQAARAQGHELTALNLGVDGILFSELACVAEAALAQRPDRIFVNVSPRPYSRDFADASVHSPRAFLCLGTGQSILDDLENEARHLLSSVIPLWQLRDVLQSAYLGGTPRATALARLDAWLFPAPAVDPLDEEDAEAAAILEEMAAKTKAAARYDGVHVAAEHPQDAGLRALLRVLASAPSTARVELVYVRENVAALAGMLDLAHYERESAAFIARVQAAVRGTHVRLRVVEASVLGDHFTDHIHPDVVGYRTLARLLLSEER